MRQRWDRATVGKIAGAAALVLLPLVIGDSYLRHLVIVAMIYAVIASNWDLSLGYGGIFNFAHLAFFGVGVYFCAIVSKVLGVSPWLAIPAAGLAAAFEGEQPPVTAVKSMLGETLGASGAFATIALIEAMHGGVLPGIRGLEEVEKDLPLRGLGAEPREIEARRGLVDAVGLDGNVSALVVERLGARELSARLAGKA